MAYAQRDYPQLLGNSTTETISEAGCFLTSFCNLLDRWGEAIDPPSLNEFFKHNGKFIGADDLAWSSVSAYDSNVVVQDVGTASTPDSNDAIVEFRYNSVHTGQLITHFCLVDHIEGSQVFIVDSWDGSIKGPNAYQSVYHTPIAWASYIKNTPVPTLPPPPYSIESIPSKDLVVNIDTHKWNLEYPDFASIVANPVEITPAQTQFTAVAILHHNSSNDYYLQDAGITVGWNVKDCEDYVAPAPLPPPAPYVPPAAPVTVPMQTSSIYISNTVMTFLSATAALNHTNAQATVGPGKYIVYTTSPDGMFYINKNTGDIKVWINPADDVAPKQEPPHVPIISQPSPTVATAQTVPAVTQVSVSTIPKSNITGWRSTYKPFHPQAPLIPVKYVAIQDFVLHDLGGQRPDLYILEDKEFGLYGTFTGPDGKEYLRAKTNGDAAFQYWYGVPMQHPEGGVGYVVTAGILEIFPKPIQHGYIYGVATVEKAIDIVWKKFTKKQGVRK